MAKFMINNIPMQIVTSTGVINATASISPNRMEMKPKGTEIEDYVKKIVNEEIRTPENTKYFKSLMLEVLVEQGLIEVEK
jgi:hypothetical protein